MRRVLTTACLLFALATGAVTAYIIGQDREDTLRVVGERTRSMSRMIIAHGDAAVDSALQIINTIEPVVATWDLHDPARGTEISARFKEMVQGNNVLASAWVVDAQGTNIVDSWSYPSKPVSATDRPYFKAHLAGAADPVVTGDNRPGSISGKERFTVSRAIRNPDGTLRAVIVVGVYTSVFDTLYKEAVTWPGARAGLYTLNGGILARIRNAKPASPAFVAEMNRRVQEEPSGTALVQQEEEPRIVSWNRSAAHPQVFATSSQPVTDALVRWTERAWTTALLALAVNLMVWVLAWFILRWLTARQQAEANALAVREVNHRVQNSLQLISSLMQIRARRSDDAAYRGAVSELTNQLNALSETYRFVQGANAPETVDAAATLKGLCRHLEESYGVEIEADAGKPLTIHAAHATAFAVIVNELVTNAIKHGGSPVKVTLDSQDETVTLAIASAHGHLPDGFDLEQQKGFGLKAVRTMLQPLAGRLIAANAGDEGTAFTVLFPTASLQKP